MAKKGWKEAQMLPSSCEIPSESSLRASEASWRFVSDVKEELDPLFRFFWTFVCVVFFHSLFLSGGDLTSLHSEELLPFEVQTKE